MSLPTLPIRVSKFKAKTKKLSLKSIINNSFSKIYKIKLKMKNLKSWSKFSLEWLKNEFILKINYRVN